MGAVRFAGKAALADACRPLSFRTLGKIDGRVLDLIVGADGRRLHGVALSHIVNATYPDVLRYRFHQKADGHLKIELQLKPEAQIILEMENRLRTYLYEKLGTTLPIEVIYVNNFPPSPSGKFRWVISEKS